MNYLHGDSAAERWHRMTLAEQIGNIGSEVSRTASAQGKNESRFDSALALALELFDLTLSDSRWSGRLREIGRMREVFCDAALGGAEYGSNLFDLQKYFDQFAYAANRLTDNK